MNATPSTALHKLRHVDLPGRGDTEFAASSVRIAFLPEIFQKPTWRR